MLFISCSQDFDDSQEDNILSTALVGKEVVLGNVIACAASNEDPSVVSIFLYPREGVTNINFYETSTVAVDNMDFSNYQLGDASLVDVFNGYLLKYEVAPTLEKWVIVSFEEDGAIQLSNPIRLKHLSRATEYLPQNIAIDLAEPTMPIFTWQDGTFDDTAIYFHVISDANDELFSGTYTFERLFQYYNLENVVLNITEVQPPPTLLQGQDYNFTLLAVSEDNWVNLFATRTFNLN